MKLAIMQPYFFPYIGYWQLINAVDTFVIYDDVNYINRGWINRNRILVNKKEYLLTLPLKKPSQNKLINGIEVCAGRDKLVQTVAMAYKRAPYFDSTMPLIEEILHNPVANLALFLEFSIRKICRHLGIPTKIVVSSEIEKNNALRGQAKVLEICDKFKANRYINTIGGQELYDPAIFNGRGIELEFLQPPSLVYGQFGNEFVPSLSIIDVLMFNGQEVTRHFLNNRQFVQANG